MSSIKKMVLENKAVAAVVALISAVLAYYLYEYLYHKGHHHDTLNSDGNNINPAYKSGGMGGGGPTFMDMSGKPAELPSAIGVSGGSGGSGGSAPAIAPLMPTNPTDLLPKDKNSEWASVNPLSNNPSGNVFLKAGAQIGISSGVFKNASLQERSDPPIGTTVQTPWNQSTIVSDTLRPSLEIGQGER